LISQASRAANSGAGQLEETGAMGELTDKIKGNVNEAVGKAKQHSDDPDTRDEGAGQEVKGKVEQVVGSVKGALGNKV
jgi:uncharacterized protein YjbJ (UPF0337 family)